MEARRMRVPFDRWDYAEIAAVLRNALAAHEPAARVVAASMHELPHGPVKVCKVERYERSLSSSRSLLFDVAFPTWQEFDDAIRDEDPGALQSDFFLVEPKLALAQAEDEADAETQLSLAIAPDAVGKAGFSGGQEVVLVPARSPEERLDARVLGVAGEPLLLERLRETFRWGGFPGLAGATGALGAVIQRLAAICEPV